MRGAPSRRVPRWVNNNPVIQGVHDSAETSHPRWTVWIYTENTTLNL